MKKLTAAFLFLFLLGNAGAVRAGEAPRGDLMRVRQFFETLPPAQRGYWRGALTGMLPPSAAVKRPDGFWQSATQWLSGARKEKEIKALGDFLYNMYVGAGAEGKAPARLHLGFVGVLDPLEALPAYDARDMVALYQKEKAAVKARIQLRLSQGLGIVYDVHDPVNDKTEEAFLQALLASAAGGARAAYTAAPQETKRHLQQSLRRRLTAALAGQACLNDATACTYETTDMMQTLDRKNAAPPKQRFYRRVSQECDACAYAFCRQVCTSGEREYAGWELVALHRIYVKPAGAAPWVWPAQGDSFYSPRGKRHPAWDYHAAALLTLRRGREWAQAVQDPFLFEAPVSLQEWAAQFDPRENEFFAEPFRRQEGIENQFFPLPPDQLENARRGAPVTLNGVKYLPAPVRRN